MDNAMCLTEVELFNQALLYAQAFVYTYLEKATLWVTTDASSIMEIQLTYLPELGMYCSGETS